MRYWLADKLCQVLNVNQKWLYCGESPSSPYFSIPPEIQSQISPDESFSEAYRDSLVGYIKDEQDRRNAEWEKEREEWMEIILDPAIARERRWREVFHDQLWRYLVPYAKNVSPELLPAYIDALVSASEVFLKKYGE